MEELMASYLADELDEKQRADFESQLIQDEQFSLEFEAYLNAWALQEEAPAGKFDTNAAWTAVNKQITETPVVEMKNTGFSFMKIAATLLVLAVAGYFVITGTMGSDADGLKEYVTSTTGLETMELPDGTVVKLNANSKLTVADGFGVDNRNVVLTGQANFDVARNEELPFIIDAGESTVEVLGTSFDVAAYPGRDIKVTVSEGTVAFESSLDEEEKAVLNQGQRAVMDAESKEIEVLEVKDNNFKGWWTRELDFEGEALEVIFDVLENTYQVKIEYSEEIKNCPWNLQTDEEMTIDEIFETFSFAFPSIELDLKENQITLEGTACDK